jgi:hypothetical protein
MEQQDYLNIRIRKETHRVLRHIVAYTDERIIAMIDRLARQELQRLREQERYAAPQDVQVQD